MCCWYLLILGSLTLIFPAHARVQVWPVTHPNDLFITKSAFWQLHHSWILLNWIHPFICFWLLYNVYISYILVWSFIKHTLRLNPPRENFISLLLPFRRCGTLLFFFSPIKWAGILELLSARFMQKDGAEQAGMCVLGRQGKVTFPCTKGFSPIRRQSNVRWNCMSGCNPCLSWQHHPWGQQCVNMFSWNIYRCSLWLKVWTGSHSSWFLSSNSCCINCAEITLTSSRGYPLCVSVSLYRKDNSCYYVSQWECVTGGISVKWKAENLRFPLNSYFKYQRRMTSLICFKNKNQLPINLKHMLFFY